MCRHVCLCSFNCAPVCVCVCAYVWFLRVGAWEHCWTAQSEFVKTSRQVVNFRKKHEKNGNQCPWWNACWFPRYIHPKAFASLVRHSRMFYPAGTCTNVNWEIKGFYPELVCFYVRKHTTHKLQGRNCSRIRWTFVFGNLNSSDQCFVIHKLATTVCLPQLSLVCSIDLSAPGQNENAITKCLGLWKIDLHALSGSWTFLFAFIGENATVLCLSWCLHDLANNI